MLEDKNKEYWSSLDTTSIYLPTELIAYHFYLLELAKKNKRTKEEKRALDTIGTYMKITKKDMEENICLKM